MGLILIAGFALLATDTVALSQQQVLSTLSQCREIPQEQARLQCFDRLAAAVSATAAVGSVPTTTAITVSPQASSQAVVAQNSTESPVATPSAAVAATVATAPTDAVTPDPVANFGQEQRIVKTELAEMTSQVHSVKRDPFKKWIIVLANDQVWKQTDTVFLDLKAGDQVVIKRAALGSFMLGKAQVNSKIRVKRLN